MWRQFLRRLRILDWLLLLATFSGALAALIGAGLALVRWTADPFPTYGAGLSWLTPWIFAGFGGLWLLWTVAVVGRAARRRADVGAALIIGALLFSLVGCLCWLIGVDVINGLFDLGSRTPTEIVVRELFSETTSSSRGRSTSHSAYVDRVDHPDESVGIDWPGCHLPGGAAASRHVTLMMGRGALGALWYDPRIVCHPLQVSERALYKSFWVGRGRPVALITLTERMPGQPETDPDYEIQDRALLKDLRSIADGTTSERETVADALLRAAFHRTDAPALRKILNELDQAPPERHREIGRRALAFAQRMIDQTDESLLVAPWVAALRKRAPDLEIAVVRRGPSSIRMLPPKLACPDCRALVEPDLDEQTARLLAGGDPWQDKVWRIFVADGQGHPLFHADLEEHDRIPELASRLQPSSPKGP